MVNFTHVMHAQLPCQSCQILVLIFLFIMSESSSYSNFVSCAGKKADSNKSKCGNGTCSVSCHDSETCEGNEAIVPNETLKFQRVLKPSKTTIQLMIVN
jgi:hypothetical protein